MTNCADAALPAPEERFREIAAILAAAVVRLNERTALPAPEQTRQLPPKGLEVSDETVLSVHTG